MDTKTAKQIAKELEEQAKAIKETVKDYKKGIISEKTYNCLMSVRLMVIDTITKELEYNLKYK